MPKKTKRTSRRNGAKPVKLLSGQKYDYGKPRIGLIPSSALVEIGKVLSLGADKYGAHNWRNGLAWSRLVDAGLRHLIAFNDGEEVDSETGLSHLAHLSCCAMFLLEYQLRGNGLDDRWRRSDISLAK